MWVLAAFGSQGGVAEGAGVGDVDLGVLVGEMDARLETVDVQLGVAGFYGPTTPITLDSLRLAASTPLIKPPCSARAS